MGSASPHILREAVALDCVVIFCRPGAKCCERKHSLAPVKELSCVHLANLVMSMSSKRMAISHRFVTGAARPGRIKHIGHDHWVLPRREA